MSLGIDVRSMIEKLAESPSAQVEADDLDVEPVDVGDTDSRTIEAGMQKFKEAAQAEERGDTGLTDELSTLANEFEDVWRTKLGHDPPVQVEPLL